MKFLLDIVSCCGTPAGSSQVTLPEREEDEETRSLAPSVPAPRNRRKRHGRMCASASESEWKPSLGAISEDHSVVAATMEREKAGANHFKKAADRTSKFAGPKNGSRAVVHVRSYSEDYGRALMPTFVPTFAPTPFMY